MSFIARRAASTTSRGIPASGTGTATHSLRSFISATRFRQLGPPRRYLAVYEIEGPEVFQEPRYLEVTGWGEWEPLIHDWRAVVYEQVETRGGGMTKVFPEDER